MKYIALFYHFFKVSCFTFGGAYGAIPLIRDMVLQNGWLDEERLSYMIAVSESTPGPIMVNLATYIGCEQAGFWGSVLATTAVVLPAFIAVVLLTTILKAALKNPYVQAVLAGLTPCVVGVVVATGLWMTVRACIPQGLTPDLRSLAVLAILLAVMLLWKKWRKKKLSPIALIVVSAIAGILIC